MIDNSAPCISATGENVQGASVNFAAIREKLIPYCSGKTMNEIFIQCHSYCQYRPSFLVEKVSGTSFTGNPIPYSA
jgi:hypothetical protein